MLSSVSADVGTLFIENAKRYVKFDLTIDSELDDVDVESYGFVLLIDIAISNPIPNVLNKTSKKILSRFPSWTKMFEDSIDGSTPELQEPQTTAGSFINALVSDIPEYIERNINNYELDRFISTSDENQLAWIYVSSSVPASAISIRGDDVPLTKVDSVFDLYESSENDYCYYYNPIDREILTIKLFQSINIDNIIYEQIPVLKWNWFDEFGLRVGLKRLYLESNSNFKARILDVYKNKPGPSLDDFKKTLRRELDLWSAFGTTPDSDYIGAFPEILEMSDIEKTTPYFSDDGNAQDKFRSFVKEINEKYPVNWGYVKWDEGFWDYSGQDQSGIGRISASYDHATALGDYYQPGIGDGYDGKLLIQEPFENSAKFNARLKARGSKYIGQQNYYSPINMAYDYYGSYYLNYYDNPSATVNFTYGIVFPNGSVYTTNIISNPRNIEGPLSSSSPEFRTIKIFDQDGYSNPNYTFSVQGTPSQVYFSNAATPYTNRVNAFDASVNFFRVNAGSQSFSARFAGSNQIAKTATTIFMASPQFNIYNINIETASDLYLLKRDVFNTSKIRSYLSINDNNDPLTSLDKFIDPEFIRNNIIFPPSATPLYIHIENASPNSVTSYGGISNNPNTLLDEVIMSSPNIIAQYINPNFSTPHLHEGYINTIGSTVNYYFNKLKYPYKSTPNFIKIKSQDVGKYPYKVNIFEDFTAYSTPMISGEVNSRGVVRSNIQNFDETFSRNSNLIGTYDIGYPTFGLNAQIDSIEKIEIENIFDGVDLSLNAEFVKKDSDEYFLSNIISQSADNNLSDISAYAEYLGKYSSALHTGWMYANNEEYYIYASPNTENHTTPGFFVNLNSVARQGAPIIVNRKIGSNITQLREVCFYDDLNPSTPSIRNVEVVYGNKGNGLYLGYENVYDVDVIDLVTGYTVATNKSSNTNYINIFSQSTPSVPGRQYEVSYFVKDSFLSNNDYYNSLKGNYVTRLQFDSTPSSSYSYEITYESSINLNSTPIQIDVNPIKMWDQEGFIYYSDKEYAFSNAEISLEPNYISDDYQDYMVLQILSLDINSNPKPYQTFSISGFSATPSSTYATTDINGYVNVYVKYNGLIPSINSYGTITILGVNNGSLNAHPNSETQGFVKQLNFDIVSSYKKVHEIKAIADKNVIEADGISQNYIKGIIKKNQIPEQNKVIYWRKGRSIEEVFSSTPYSNYVVSDSNGDFTIGPFTASNNSEPGTWIVAVESAHASTPQVIQPKNNQNILSGDIVYWVERYDNKNYVLGNSVFTDSKLLYVEKDELIATPRFTLNYHDGSDATPYQSTPSWSLPKWYPINRYTQYQMGLLGSTPYSVSNYLYLMNDYEED